MPAPTPPNLLEAIASGASSGFITNPMPNSPTGTNAASIAGGFPPVTMTNEQAGGEPPLGQDVNGFLFLISSHTLYVQCGQLYLYDAAVAAAIGGYAVGTILGMADGSGIWMNIDPGNGSNPDVGGSGWVSIASYGVASVPVTTGTVTLTPDQYRRNLIQFTGALTGNVTAILPNVVGEWLIINSTTGAFTLTVTAGGAGVTIPQGGFSTPTGVYSVANTNVYPLVAPLSVAIDQNATPLTLVERTNTGDVLAGYFVGNTALENPTIGAVVVQNAAADGKFRKIGLTNFEAQLLLQAMSGQITNGQLPFAPVAQWAPSLFASAALTGVPTAPTAPAGTSTDQIATTAFANPGVVVNGNGVCITFPNNYKLQMGTCNPAGGSAVVTFPVAFTATPYVVPTSIAGSAVQTWLAAAPGLTNVTIRNSGGSSIWIAAGI